MIEEKNDLMKNIGGSENKKLRKYLILGGGFFILFVIGIVVSKFMFSNPKKDNTQVILAADMKTEASKDTKLFNDIPIENETKNEDKQEFKKPVEEKKEKQTNQAKEEVVKVDKTEEVEPIKQPEKVKEIEKPKKINKPKKTKSIKNSYYVQVAAVTRGNPSAKFLALIKKNGFNYKIVEVNVKGMKVKRVLVGPFSYTQVKKALPTIKAKISSSAFIKRIK